jgi:ribonuclease HI
MADFHLTHRYTKRSFGLSANRLHKGTLARSEVGSYVSPSVHLYLSEDEALDKSSYLWHFLDMTERVEIYTDGACQGNPGPGGWGVLLRYKGVEKELSGYVPETTNNRMELQAAIEGIKILKRSLIIDLYTDSQYLRNGIMKWRFQWKKNNWRLSNNKPVKNKDLWEELDALVGTHKIEWHWVKGHSGHPENERADVLATSAIEKALS